MSRPSTEAQYLASPVPALGSGHRHRQAVFCSRGAGRSRDPRRIGPSGRLRIGRVQRGGGGGTQAASGTLTFGYNQSDAVPKQAYAQLVTGFNDSNIKVTTNSRPQHLPGEHQYLSAGPAR